jgi:hypothetical protein
MFRTILFTAVATFAAFTLPTQVRAADHSHAGHFKECAKACADCQIVCDACFHHCAGLVADGKKEHAACMHLCVDCGECCALAAHLTARQSPLAGAACECCAKCCSECAAACAKFPDDKEMKMCAEECLKCEKACKAMLKSVNA